MKALLSLMAIAAAGGAGCRAPAARVVAIAPLAGQSASRSIRHKLPKVVLCSIWGSSAKDVWAVGDNGTAVHWDGTQWSSVATGTDAWLEGVWGSSPNNVWMTGGTTLLHWDGTRLSQVSTDFLGGCPNATLNAVWGSAAEDVWAAGEYAIEHYDGHGWQVKECFERSFQILSLWGSGANDVWAENNGEPDFHWDGARWSIADQIDGRVWGTSAHYIWAGPTLHFDGKSWTRLAVFTDLPVRIVRGIWGASAGDVWAVGRDGMIAHWNGRSWSLVPTSIRSNLSNLWGSASNDIWAISGDHDGRSHDRGEASIFHWDGKAWSRVTGDEASP